MIGLSLLELLVMALAIAGFVTQVGIPLYRGTVMFPFFSRERNLRKRRAEVEQAVVELKLEEEIEAKTSLLTGHRKDTEAQEAVRAYRIAQRDAGEE